MGIETTLYTIDPRSELLASMRADPEVAESISSLYFFYRETPPGKAPSWWAELGDEPVVEQFASLVASMIDGSPTLSERYLQLYKDGFWFERHFKCLARTSEEAELVRVMLNGETRVAPDGPEVRMHGSIHLTEAARCDEVARWLASLTRERLSDATRDYDDPEEASWAVGRLGWARERLGKLYGEAARTDDAVLSVWS